MVAVLHQDRITVAQIKQLLARYAEENFPGRWACAAVSVRVGPDMLSPSEVLVVLPGEESGPLTMGGASSV